jgi:hypothetical protein
VNGMFANARRICLGAASALFAYDAFLRAIGQRPGGRWAYVSAGLSFLSAAMLLPDDEDRG